jgi:hypothetical protein
MFTLKYRSYSLAAQQEAKEGSPRLYNENEMIYGPFEMISKEQDEDGYTVIHAHRAGGAAGLTVKHCDYGDQVAGSALPGRARHVILGQERFHDLADAEQRREGDRDDPARRRGAQQALAVDVGGRLLVEHG